MNRAALIAAAAVALLVAGCVACAWIEGAPLVPADAGRADGGRLGVLFLVLLDRGVRRLSRCARARAPRDRPACVRSWSLALAIQIVPLAGPLLLSTDAWTYWEYGRIAAVHGGNPYVDTPSTFSGDPSYAVRRGRMARDDVGVRPGVHAPLGARRARLRVVCRRGGLDLQGARRRRRARVCGAGRSARADRVLAAALVGWNPVFADPLRGRWSQRRTPGGARPGGARAGRSRPSEPGGCGVGGRDPDQVDPGGVSSRCGPWKRVPPTVVSTTAASPWRPSSWWARDLALRPRLGARVRPARTERGRTDELRAPTSGRAARRSSHAPRSCWRRWRWPPGSPGSSGKPCGVVRDSASRRACSSRRPPGSPRGTRSGRSRSPPRRATGARS